MVSSDGQPGDFTVTLTPMARLSLSLCSVGLTSSADVLLDYALRPRQFTYLNIAKTRLPVDLICNWRNSRAAFLRNYMVGFIVVVSLKMKSTLKLNLCIASLCVISLTTCFFCFSKYSCNHFHFFCNFLNSNPLVASIQPSLSKAQFSSSASAGPI
jgi:hypothetical protein